MKGDYLYVRTSAAEARRRLKGRGHGVRKIHSGGKDRAVIIHTATGEHPASLQDLFQDVGWSLTEGGLETGATRPDVLDDDDDALSDA